MHRLYSDKILNYLNLYSFIVGYPVVIKHCITQDVAGTSFQIFDKSAKFSMQAKQSFKQANTLCKNYTYNKCNAARVIKQIKKYRYIKIINIEILKFVYLFMYVFILR